MANTAVSANRLELLQYPITFAFGSAVITMVATAAGARDFERARHAAWTGAAVASGIGCVFTVIALLGTHWMSIFTADAAIRTDGALYLLCLAAVFPLTGLGLACYFACLGVGYVARPFLLAVARVILVVAGGWMALRFGGGMAGVALASAAAFALFGIAVFLVARARFAQLILATRHAAAAEPAELGPAQRV